MFVFRIDWGALLVRRAQMESGNIYNINDCYDGDSLRDLVSVAFDCYFEGSIHRCYRAPIGALIFTK